MIVATVYLTDILRRDKRTSPLAFSPEWVERFWQKVDKNGPLPDFAPDLGGCWLWTRGRFGTGYGQQAINGYPRMAHRVAYELELGPIPDGLQLDHLCRVRHCVRPSHLEPVTRRENILRGFGTGAVHARKTHCPQGHPYDEANTYVRPGSGGRMCRICMDEKQRAKYASWRKDAFLAAKKAAALTAATTQA